MSNQLTNTSAAHAAALAMRDAAAALARRRPLYDGSGEPADEDLAQAIEDLPLPDADTTDWKAEADALRRQFVALAARLAEIERAEPVAWVPMHPRQGALWAMTTATPSEERLPSHYPLSPLYDRPAQAAAPERAEPSAPLSVRPGRMPGPGEPPEGRGGCQDCKRATKEK